MAYIYRHIRADKNQPFYIGVGLRDNGYKRAFQRGKHKRSEHWQRIAKNGYEVEILLDGLTEEQAFQKEIEFIALYGRIDKGTGTLCNHTDGGDRPAPMFGDDNPSRRPEVMEKISMSCRYAVVSEGAKAKIRDAHISKRSMPHPLKGRKRSPEATAKMTSNVSDPKTMKKTVYQKTFSGDLVAVWPSAGDAAKSGNGWGRVGINSVVTKRKYSAYGFLWSYEP